MTTPHSFYHPSLIHAWAIGARHVATATNVGFVIAVGCGTDWGASAAELKSLDAEAGKRSCERPSSVSEMILPSVCEGAFENAAEAIDRGLQFFGRARGRGLRFSGWTHTYFERLVGQWQDKDGSRHCFRSNKLLDVITQLNLWNRNAESACYIHIPMDNEGFRTRGGPCLQYVQFRAHGNHLLDVIGLYRAHDYANKALGNLVGLDRLGRFVARHIGRELNGISVVSLHPYTDQRGRLLNLANDVAPQ